MREESARASRVPASKKQRTFSRLEHLNPLTWLSAIWWLAGGHVLSASKGERKEIGW